MPGLCGNVENLVKISNMKPQTTFHDQFNLFHGSQLVPSPEFPFCLRPTNSLISIALPLKQALLWCTGECTNIASTPIFFEGSNCLFINVCSGSHLLEVSEVFSTARRIGIISWTHFGASQTWSDIFVSEHRYARFLVFPCHQWTGRRRPSHFQISPTTSTFGVGVC